MIFATWKGSKWSRHDAFGNFLQKPDVWLLIHRHKLPSTIFGFQHKAYKVWGEQAAFRGIFQQKGVSIGKTNYDMFLKSWRWNVGCCLKRKGWRVPVYAQKIATFTWHFSNCNNWCCLQGNNFVKFAHRFVNDLNSFWRGERLGCRMTLFWINWLLSSVMSVDRVTRAYSNVWTIWKGNVTFLPYSSYMNWFSRYKKISASVMCKSEHLESQFLTTSWKANIIDGGLWHIW